MSVDVGKMVTKKQNGSTKMTKMKRIIQSVKSNKEFPTSFAGSVFGISNELMVGFSVADDAGNGLKRRKVQDSSLADNAGNGLKRRKVQDSSLADNAGNGLKRRKVQDSSTLRKEIGLSSQRKEIGLSSQRKENGLS